MRRPIFAIFCTGLLISTGLSETAPAEDPRAEEAPQSAPVVKAADPDGLIPYLQTSSTIKWIGLVGLGLIILRGVRRQ